MPTSASARAALSRPEQSDRPAHPGIALRQHYLDPLGISAEDLARALGVPLRRIAEIEAGARPLDADMALRLALFFDVPARWWLEMQARHDADDPERLSALREAVTPYAGLDDVLVTPSGVRHLDAASKPSGPLRVHVSEALLSRLRESAERSPARPSREPTGVELDDGTPILTGR